MAHVSDNVVDEVRVSQGTRNMARNNIGPVSSPREKLRQLELERDRINAEKIQVQGTLSALNVQLKRIGPSQKLHDKIDDAKHRIMQLEGERMALSPQIRELKELLNPDVQKVHEASLGVLREICQDLKAIKNVLAEKFGD